MEQVIFGGYYDLLNDTDTEYNSLVGGYLWTSTAETWRTKIVSTDGVIKQLRVKLSGAPGGTDKYTFTLMLNGNPTVLAFDIVGAATTGSNMVNEITVTDGDLVSLRCIPTDTPTPVYATWSCVFEGDTAAESLIQGGSGFALSTADIEYCQVMGGSNYGVTELNYRQVVPTSGTLKDFYVWLTSDPGTAPDAYRFTVRLNGATVAQSLIVTITADDTTGSDLVHNLVVAASDILTLMIEPLNTPSVAPHANWGMTFVADTPGESIILGATSNNLPDVDTEYNSILPGQDLQTWIANENERYQLGQVCTLKKFYVLLAGSPGAGNKYDFTIRLGGGDSNIVTTIADAATTGNSGALEDTVALDEYVSLKVVPTDSPTIRDAYWGLVCYIMPPPLSEDLFSKFSIPAIYSITGITKDKAGNRLGNCEVALFRTVAGNPPTYLFIESGISDGNGDYSFTNLIKTEYFVRAQKDGSPSVFDTTDNEVESV